SFDAICGNGTKEGSEECDGGAGCQTDCLLVPVCGDGKIGSGEACDDGDVDSGDGCSATCTVETGYICNSLPSNCYVGSLESEDNGTCGTADGPFTVPFIFAGSLSSSDLDYVSFTVPTHSDVRIETFGPKVGECPTTAADTLIELRGTTCTAAALATDDDDGINDCSVINPSVDTGARHLAPGTYTVRVSNAAFTAIPSYNVRVSFDAICGNGTKEGSEECDGGAGCQTDCLLVPVCGDGKVGPGEACDDGDLDGGDGCSATCTVEANYLCSGSPSVCAQPCDAGDTLVTLTATGLPKGTPTSVTPAVASPMVTTLTNTTTGTVKRVIVGLSITHTYDSDLSLTLVSPASTSVDLSSGNGASNDNYTKTVFDQQCATTITAGSAPFTGCYKPEGSLTPLNGQAAAGDWKLQISDSLLSLDAGTLDALTLNICVTPPTP
ncbi:MAG: hypothetical protein EOO74_07545, partial [Myxococcales bacterium]